MPVFRCRVTRLEINILTVLRGFPEDHFPVLLNQDNIGMLARDSHLCALCFRINGYGHVEYIIGKQRSDFDGCVFHIIAKPLLCLFIHVCYYFEFGLFVSGQHADARCRTLPRRSRAGLRYSAQQHFLHS